MNPAELLPFVLILAAFYLLILRPARNRQRQQAQLQAQVEPGVQVMTTSGLYGTVTGVEDDVLLLEVAPGIVVRLARAAVGRVVTEPSDEESADGSEISGTSDARADVDETAEEPTDRRPGEDEGRTAG